MSGPGEVWASFLRQSAREVDDMAAALAAVLAAEQIPAPQAQRIVEAVLGGGSPAGPRRVPWWPGAAPPGRVARLLDRFAVAGAVQLVDWDGHDEQTRMMVYGRCRCGRGLGGRTTWTLGDDGHVSGYMDVACPDGHTVPR